MHFNAASPLVGLPDTRVSQALWHLHITAAIVGPLRKRSAYTLQLLLGHFWKQSTYLWSVSE